MLHYLHYNEVFGNFKRSFKTSNCSKYLEFEKTFQNLPSLYESRDFLSTVATDVKKKKNLDSHHHHNLINLPRWSNPFPNKKVKWHQLHTASQTAWGIPWRAGSSREKGLSLRLDLPAVYDRKLLRGCPDRRWVTSDVWGPCNSAGCFVPGAART